MQRIYLLGVLNILLAVPATTQLQRFSFSETRMGGPFSIILYAPDSLQAAAAAKDCFLLTDSLVNVLSDYIDSSELNRLCARAGSHIPFACSPVLWDILDRSSEACRLSEGSFDITLGSITRLWRRARKEKIFPPPEKVKQALAHTGCGKMETDKTRHTVYLQQAGMQLDLGGIGQGYIAQQVSDRLKQLHIDNVLINVSGDIVCTGSPPGKKGWTVAINVPESESALLPRHLLISNLAVTTSGDVYQYLEHDGKRYSHIINPATGYGITSQKNVTVIAPDGTLADWLTKACSILPLQKAKKLAARLHAELLVAEIQNGKPVFHASKGFWTWHRNNL